MDLFKTNGSSPPKRHRLKIAATPGRTDVLSMAEYRRKHAAREPELDFAVSDHGSICLLQPLTEDARVWVEEHLPIDRMYFGSAVAVEPRYVVGIAEGIHNSGLRVARAH